jgi:hypothetical protein
MVRGKNSETFQFLSFPFTDAQHRFVDVIDWICRAHGIPKLGPPSATAWRIARGHWHGVLGHANVAQGGFFHTDHGDTLLFYDFMALGIFPS